MTVFKCYMKIIKKNAGMIIMYFVIFTVISVAMLYVSKDSNSKNQFMESKLEIAVVDNDKSEISGKLIKYLSQIHNIKIEEDNISVLQEEMYYQKYNAIIKIPEGFSDNFIKGDKTIKITQQPGQFDYMYIESQVNDFMNRMIKYNIAGYTIEESFKRVSDIKESKVTLMDINGNGGNMPDFAYLFQYFPYISIAILGNTLGIIVCSFRKREVKKRIAASAVPLYRQSAEAFLAFAITGIIIWAGFIVIVMALNGKELLESQNKFYYILNSLTVMVLSLSIAFLTGILAKKTDVVNMIVTPVSLFMSFLGGVFVPLSILNNTVRKAARFVPVYWYEEINNKLSEYEKIPQNVVKEFWTGTGMQLLFTIMFISIALAISKYQNQER